MRAARGGDPRCLPGRDPPAADRHLPRRRACASCASARSSAWAIRRSLRDLRRGRPARAGEGGDARARTSTSARSRPAAVIAPDQPRQEPDARRPRTVEQARADAARGDASPRSTGRYEERLRRAGAVDFDDLLLLVGAAVRDGARRRSAGTALWRYVLVDEYQDTNRAQYRIVPAPDRGAPEPLRRRRSRPVGLPVARAPTSGTSSTSRRTSRTAGWSALEQNYRSTKRILEIASAVIAQQPGAEGQAALDRERRGRSGAASTGPGTRTRRRAGWPRPCAELRGEGQPTTTTSRCFYRTNAQSRVLEDALPARGHPLPHRGRRALLRAARDQGRRRVPPARREPRRRRGLPARRGGARRAASARPRSTAWASSRRARRARRSWPPARALSAGHRGQAAPRARGVRAPDRAARRAARGRAGARRRSTWCVSTAPATATRSARSAPPRPRRGSRTWRSWSPPSEEFVAAARKGGEPVTLEAFLDSDRLGGGHGRDRHEARRRDPDDAALGQGARVPGGVPHRAGGGRLPALALHGRRRRSSRRSGGSATSASPAPRSGSSCRTRCTAASRATGSREPSRFLLEIPADAVVLIGSRRAEPARPAGGVARTRVGARAGSGPRPGRRVPVPRRGRCATRAGARGSSSASRGTARTSSPP